jgi:hypothetical protein
MRLGIRRQSRRISIDGRSLAHGAVHTPYTLGSKDRSVLWRQQGPTPRNLVTAGLRLRTRTSPAVMSHVGASDGIISPKAPSAKSCHIRRQHFVVASRLFRFDNVGILPLIAEAERGHVSPAERVFRTVRPYPCRGCVSDNKDNNRQGQNDSGHQQTLRFFQTNHNQFYARIGPCLISSPDRSA